MSEKPLNTDRDPARWAREFNAVLKNLKGLPPLDEGWLISWFANAMMCGEDTYRWRTEQLPSEESRLAEMFGLLGNIANCSNEYLELLTDAGCRDRLKYLGNWAQRLLVQS